MTCFIEFIIYDNKCPLERDTAGQERFAPIGSMYYQGAKAVIFTYDITKVILSTQIKTLSGVILMSDGITQKRTFDSLPMWRQKFDDRNEG